MKQADGTTVPMPIDNLLQELKDDIQTAKEDGSEMDSRSYNYQEGKILSFNECQMILDYIEKLKKS